MMTKPWDDAGFLLWLRADAALGRLEAWATEHLDTDPGHNLAHALRVAYQAARLALELGACPREATAAALLHDVVNIPKDDPRRAESSSLSAAKASELLPTYGFGPDAIARISDAIRDHSFSRGATPTHALGQALQDADRLEALGVIGLFRCISTGVLMGASYFDDTDPFGLARPLDDRRYSIDHFYTKLLRLPQSFLTEAGRAEAEKRATYLKATLVQLADELGVELRPFP